MLGTEGDVQIAIGSNHVRAQIGDIRFTSKLIDGRFPEYGRVIPAASPKAIVADREMLRASPAADRDSLEREVSRSSARAQEELDDAPGA